MKIYYLFTTFPVLTETFLQREIRSLLKGKADIKLFSIWKGDELFDKETPIEKFSLWNLIKLFIWLPYWAIKKPNTLSDILVDLWNKPVPYFQNWQENFLGLGFAIINAHRFKRESPDRLHAPWATMPSAAALLLSRLTGIPYSMEGHAYDLFREGGDWLLSQKLKNARIIRTSNITAQNRLLEHDVDPIKIHLIRRGLDHLTTYRPPSFNNGILRIISVGRLHPKKGYPFQLSVYKALKEAGINFHASIIGGGDLHQSLQLEIDRLKLTKHVTLHGKMEHDDVQTAYTKANLFLFTGEVSKDGNRDGFPNVVGEAMAHGIPILTTNIADAGEVITDGINGFKGPFNDSQAWLNKIEWLLENESKVQETSAVARKWIEESFSVNKNTNRLRILLEA